MPVEPGVLDANILAYAIDADAPQNAASRALRVIKTAASADAVCIISNLLALPGLRVLPTPSQTVRHLMELLRKKPVKGAEIFDLQIAAWDYPASVSRLPIRPKQFRVRAPHVVRIQRRSVP